MTEQGIACQEDDSFGPLTPSTDSEDLEQSCFPLEDKECKLECPQTDDASNCIEGSTLDPYDYQSGPDPLHFTVRLPNLAATECLPPRKPEWKLYSNCCIDPTTFTSGLVCTSDGTLIHRSQYKTPMELDNSENEVGESDSDLDHSVVHQIEDLDFSAKVHGEENGVRDPSTNSLPLHYLLSESKAKNQVKNKSSGDVSKLAKFQKNGLNELFTAGPPKLCIGLPSEGPLPK